MLQAERPPEQPRPEARHCGLAAAALALARQADGARGSSALQSLNDVADKGAPAARLTARVARAFVGRADAMESFLHILRDGD